MRTYRDILTAVASGQLAVDEALAALRGADSEDLGYANIDHQRTLRKGFAEVVYCEGKTVEHAAEILARLAARGESNVLGTRASEAVYLRLREEVADAEYHPVARTILIRRGPQRAAGEIAVVAAGTSDLPVAEEAAVTCEAMGSRVTRVYDVGVAGLHRLLRRIDTIRRARVIVAVAGMEGALVSVLAGLVDKPVIGVPTSVGYGAQLRGFVPLMSMLTSCVPGMAVVNIDNGFGAGYLASMINRMAGHEGSAAAHEEGDDEAR
ncbi:1-(5-phosphoribosyl)-5-amino-4-imidazole-carboxylate carboxylase [Alicyclobacillus cellulosilyticus]|uniref:1-(5-phosphoribosyl)-5-amino-4-imidazole-carboxylate carboxylase n=1 Tax=Alicyclobacillus cellulosilyticus TaxID=1003997 RepID=A0A917NI21_9BACL|nr:nickel pincer cofactor biosynthesis protein LarB [Alicyclobacillus cellulosilyticus]GGJ02110.1 1-(5-phosphoribosyl)-5-amino-4-imidazole-carboxylate carboxylase [Alicyclobacillus cellulosilyticus]